MSTSGATAQASEFRKDSTWKGREQSQEAQYIRQKEKEQLEAIRQTHSENKDNDGIDQVKHPMDRDFEGGFGGQEDLEDRYATTSGEH
ncbi:hypothetical protein JR316_0003617 [Psilocybe cubensis]|uniref:Uncharacterized protein n=2 Tax=Psilocybe cubensis TaxID=181762 RepID=A0ACB8H915_PSICU|nr:hypothetical protein JR316_0003617 [Psilocybe cubensis]KAH9484137.1 hypothetical protein JR316_0003617 [Psilocybe cubensis]